MAPTNNPPARKHSANSNWLCGAKQKVRGGVGGQTSNPNQYMKYYINPNPHTMTALNWTKTICSCLMLTGEEPDPIDNYFSLTRAGGSDVTWSKKQMGAPARTQYVACPKGGQWVTHKHAAWHMPEHCSQVTRFTAWNDAFLVAAVSVLTKCVSPKYNCHG